MRKFLSLFIAVAMLLSLAPTIAFADDVAPIVIDFTKATLPDGATKVDGASSIITSPEFTCVEAECSSYKDAQRTHYKTAEGMKLLTVGVSHGSWSSLPWTDVNGNAAKAKWTIEFAIPTAGWYTIDFLNGIWASAADFFIYADGQYAGVLNCYDASMTDTFHSGSDKLENAVYLTPDENGKIKMMFALKAQYAGSPGRMLLNKMTLTYVGANSPLTIAHTIPAMIEYEGSADFEVSVKNSDGSLFSDNGYNSDRSESGDILSVEIKEGSSVALSKVGSADGVYSYKLDAKGIGKSTLLITSDAGGGATTKEVIVTVANPTVAETIELEFTKTTMDEPYKIAPPNWTLTDKANFAIVWDETTTYNGARFNDASVFEGGKILWLGTRAYSNLTWIKAKQNASANYIDAMFTVETDLYVPGWYNFSMIGGLNASASEYYVYVNGKYAGLYNFYKEDQVSYGLGEKKSLNSLYLTPDENNKVKISICVAATHYSTAYAAPYKMWLTPVEGNNVTFKGFKHNLPATMQLGESADVSLYAEMSDGTYRHINGYKADATADADNALSVSVKSGDALGVESSYNSLLSDGVFTGKLTANKPGETVFTAKVIIDGAIYSEEIKVTVPAEEPEAPGEEADTIVNVYVAPENGGSVKSGDITVGSINEVAIGKKITVKAEDSDALKFSYWRNAAGKFISSDREYTFKANTNTSLIAVFDKAASSTDNTAKVIFYNENKALIASKDVEKGTTFASAKSGVATSMTGYAFREWSISDDSVIDSLTRAVALYDVKNVTYSAYIFDGDETVPAYMSNGKYEDTITYTAKGDNFSYWVVKDGSNRIVSYDKTISFKLWANMALAAVYADNSEPAPTIVLDEEDGAYFIAYSVPAGYEKVSAGIVFSKTGTPTVNNCFSRATAESTTATGQFTALPAEDETIARGYLMFKKDGEIRVVYAD